MVDPLPDLRSLTDEKLKTLIDELQAQEREVSHARGILHGKIDILRAELVARLQRSGGRSVLDQVDVRRLTDILGGEGGESAPVRRWPRRPLGSGSVSLELPEEPD